jgi:hypothetical protein
MLSNQEIITELKYVIERGVPEQVENILLVLTGTLNTENAKLLEVLAKNNQDFAITIKTWLTSGYEAGQ